MFYVVHITFGQSPIIKLRSGHCTNVNCVNKSIDSSRLPSGRRKATSTSSASTPTPSNITSQWSNQNINWKSFIIKRLHGQTETLYQQGRAEGWDVRRLSHLLLVPHHSHLLLVPHLKSLAPCWMIGSKDDSLVLWALFMSLVNFLSVTIKYSSATP